MIKDTYIFYSIALNIAHIAHSSQTRNDGITPYVVHPIQLATMFEDNLDKAISMLHDVVEDTDWDIESIKSRYMELLEAEGYSFPDFVYELSYILKGLKLLTHVPGQPYSEYIDQIVGTVYVKFKIADIAINLADRPSRKQKEKYTKAIAQLVGKKDNLMTWAIR